VNALFIVIAAMVSCGLVIAITLLEKKP